MKALHILSVATILTLLTSCATPKVESRRAIEGEQLRLALIGIWGNSDDEGRTFWGYDEFTSDGYDIATGIIPETGRTFRSVATYTVTGNKNCMRTTESDNQSIGDYFCDEILYIDEKILRYRSPFTSEIKTLYRVKQKE